MPDAAGLPKLKEGVEHARSWLERSQVCVGGGYAAQEPGSGRM